MKKSFRLIASLFMLLVVAIALTACSNKKYEQAMTNVSLLLDTTWDQNERLDDDNNSLGSFVNSDFTVPYEINVDGEIIGVSYEISGTGAAVVKNDSAKTVTIDVTQTGEAQKFTLTVTIEKVDPRSWEFNVDALDLSMEKTQAEIDAMNPMTYEEYAAAESGDSIVIQGYITHPHDYSSSYAQGSVWLQDDNGGYYAYRVKVNSQREWDTYFKEGNKIAIVGKKSPFNGWDEVGSGSTYYYIKDAEPKKYDFEDVTSLWGGLKPNSKEAQAVQNKKVTVTAKVASVDEYNSEDMKVGLTVNGQTGYGAFFKDSYLGALPENYLSDLEVGYTIKIEGIVSISRDGAQICPIATECYTITSKVVTDQDRIDAAIAAVSRQEVVEENYSTLNAPLELITEYVATGDVKVAISYELKDVEGNGITLTDGNKLMVTVDPQTASKATLVATAKLDGVENKTHEWNIVTKTNQDVLEEEVAATSGQSLTYTAFTTELRGARVDLYKSSRAKIVYALESNDVEKYVKIGQYASGGYYLEACLKDKDHPDYPEDLLEFNVLATITYGEGENAKVDSVVLTFNVVDALKALTEAEEKAQQDIINNATTTEEPLTVTYQGTVVHSNTNKPVVLLQTSAGAVYVRALGYGNKFENTFKVGNVVRVTGSLEYFNGLYQIVLQNGAGTIVTNLEGAKPSYTDITSIISNGANPTELRPLMAHLVELKGAMYTGSGFKVGNGEIAWYLDGKILNGDLETKLVVGNTYDVKGFVNIYKNYQISPISTDAVSLVSEATDEFKAQYELDSVVNSLNNKTYSEDASVTLAAKGDSFDNVELTYALDGTYTTVSLADGKLNITPANTEEVVKIKVTAKLGSVVKEGIITITTNDTIRPEMEKTQAEIDAMKPMTYEQYAAAGENVAVTIQGYVTYTHLFKKYYDDYEVSLWLQDENGGYYAYNMYLYSTTEEEAKAEVEKYLTVGKKIAIVGKKSPHYGWDEIGSGSKYYAITDAKEKTFEYVDLTNTLSAKPATDESVIALQNTKAKFVATVTEIGKVNDFKCTVKVTIGANVYTVYLKDDYLGTEYEDSDIKLEVGKTYLMEGFLAVSNDALQLCPSSLDFAKEQQVTETPDTVLGIEKGKVQAALDLIPNINAESEMIYDLYVSEDNRVQVSYKVEQGSEYATIAENKITFANLPSEQANVKIVATIVVTFDASNTATADVSKDITVVGIALSNWEKYYNAAAGDTVIAEGVIYAVGINGKNANILIQGEDGAYLVYVTNTNSTDINEKFKVNHKVTVVGPKGEYSQKQQISLNGSVEGYLDGVTLGEEVDPVEPINVTELLSKNELTFDPYEASYIKIENATYDGKNLVVGDGSIEYYTDKSFAGMPNLLKGATYTVSGWLNRYNDNLELTPVSASDVVVVSIPNSIKLEQELNDIKELFATSYTKDATINVYANGKTYEDVVLSYTLEVDYTSVSYVDNVITISPKDDKEEISLKVVASIGEDQAEIVIKFTTQVSTVVEGETITLTQSVADNVANIKDGTDITEYYENAKDNVSLIVNKNNSSTLPSLNKDGGLRLYGNASDGVGNELNITSLNGKKIVKISITWEGNNAIGGAFKINDSWYDITDLGVEHTTEVSFVNGVDTIKILNSTRDGNQINCRLYIYSISITFAA